MISHLQMKLKDMDIGIAFVYCAYKEAEQQSPTNLLTSLVHQLVPRHSIVAGDLAALYETHMPKVTRPSINEYTVLLQAAVAGFSKVLIVIDALDECADHDRTRQGLLEELRKLQSKACLLITSRDLPSIQRQLHSASRVDIEASDNDIRKYLDDRIRKSEKIRLYVKKHSGLHGLIVKMIKKEARGM